MKKKSTCLLVFLVSLMMIVSLTAGSTLSVFAEDTVNASHKGIPKTAKAVSYKVGKVKSVSIRSAGCNSIKLKWKKACNAKKYQIFRKASKNGKYTKIKTTSKLYFENIGLKEGRKYYYKIRGINGKLKGKFSAVKSLKAGLEKPVIIGDTEYIYGCFNGIEWKQVPGSNRYVIYRSNTRNGAYKRIGVVRPYATYEIFTTFDDFNVKYTKTYYYKVKAFHNLHKSPISDPFKIQKKIYSSKYSNNTEVETVAVIGNNLLLKAVSHNSKVSDILANVEFSTAAGSVFSPAEWLFVRKDRASYALVSPKKGRISLPFRKYDLGVFDTSPVNTDAFDVTDYTDQLDIQKISSPKYRDYEIGVRITNNSDETLEDIEIFALCRNSENEIINCGVLNTVNTGETFSPGETETLKIKAVGKEKYDAADVELYCNYALL